jgi:hypothetical protein
MNKTGWISRLSKQRPSHKMLRRIAGGIGVAISLLTAGSAAAQSATSATPFSGVAEKIAAPAGYSIHQSGDMGGNIANIKGSRAMYGTLVNIQSGPRVQGEAFELRALPGNKNTLVDRLKATGSGFGGEPNDFAKLNFSKGKLYDFSGTFRRDRQYFDYDLLGNPNITTGLSIPIGPSNAPVGLLAWPQVNQSPVLFNTVRRMTDTSLTLFPLSKLTYRAAYSQNIFQGPSLTPSYNIAAYNAVLEEFQRNSTDDFTGAIDWKPVQGTRVSLEEQIDHYKADSFFTLNPSAFMVQEADGTPVYLGNWDSQTAYGVGACNTASMGSGYNAVTKVATILSAPIAPNGLPVINPACDVVTSYTRTQPTRILTPTESLLLQSSSLKNLSMNGNFRYTNANMNLPAYYENFQGLDAAARSITYTANAIGHRQVVSGDFGIVWQAMKKVSLSDQVDYSNVHQPGSSTFTSKTTLSAPTTGGNETINFAGPLTRTVAAGGTSSISGASLINTSQPAYFGQSLLTNNFTGSWELSPRATLSLTYRYSTHTIAENLFASTGSGATFAVTDFGGNPGNIPLGPGATNDGTVVIHENGGIFNAALRPSANWELNGSVEALYDDNAFTPVGPRQTRHYRVHTRYRPRPWATISGAYNDLERHNNTNNNQITVAQFVPPTATVAASGTPYEGPLQHVDYSRVASFGAVLSPNEHYGLDFNYAYSDVYASTNICYLNGATATLPGAVQTAASTPCPNIFGRGATGATEVSGAALSDWFAKDFSKAPTQYASVAVLLSPNKTIHSNIGYRISDVNGSRFFNDARDVNGSLVSKYQSPFVNVAWTVHSGWIWKAEYNYYGYGEGGPSGSQFCSTSTSAASTVVPCTSLAQPTGLTESSAGLTAPRNFHANNVTIGMHYEF